MKKWLLLLAAAAAASPAAAQKANTESPKPAPEISSFDYFNGRWGCTGHMIGNAMIPPHPTAASAMSAPELSGFWRLFRYSERRTNENPSPFAATGMWGYDVAGKKYIQIEANNAGDHSVETSSGWAGDTIVFEGETALMGQRMNARDTFTKKGPEEFTHTSEHQGADGKWARFDEETCKRGAPRPPILAPAKPVPPKK